eukprot:COSAG02_NODE_29534_length_567_cov_1.260684_1_plen_143_part_10
MDTGFDQIHGSIPQCTTEISDGGGRMSVAIFLSQKTLSHFSLTEDTECCTVQQEAREASERDTQEHMRDLSTLRDEVADAAELAADYSKSRYDEHTSTWKGERACVGPQLFQTRDTLHSKQCASTPSQFPNATSGLARALQAQ